ncbi:THAP domain-containing protein 1-like [Cataglyphis hispanica]|uniref:THAP domain-containing protein 1-like n=1 Tax=Cataglyphis hispanica TaxID=1086592 RepID=UPI00217F3234|nr:THAP domain-containing protein 1-like [Cataglyphis hispanica]
MLKTYRFFLHRYKLNYFLKMCRPVFFVVQNKGSKIEHKFPLNNPELLEKWVAATELKDFIPNDRSLLCSYHFDKKCLRSSNRGLVLKSNAVPTLFSSVDSEGY